MPLSERNKMLAFLLPSDKAAYDEVMNAELIIANRQPFNFHLVAKNYI